MKPPVHTFDEMVQPPDSNLEEWEARLREQSEAEALKEYKKTREYHDFMLNLLKLESRK